MSDFLLAQVAGVSARRERQDQRRNISLPVEQGNLVLLRSSPLCVLSLNGVVLCIALLIGCTHPFAVSGQLQQTALVW